jgi:hypothetical protein
MEKKQIENVIDLKIENSYKEGHGHMSIVSQLETSRRNIRNVVERDGLSIEGLESLEWESIHPTRLRYYAHYIAHCECRIRDIEWIKSKKSEFPLYENSKIFRMLKLRDRLSGK